MKRQYPVTPDGRYFVVKGRLWRCTNPSMSAEREEFLVRELMDARRAKGKAVRSEDAVGREAARQRIDKAKHELGERGVVWWTDGAQDQNRRLAVNTPYASWFASLPV